MLKPRWWKLCTLLVEALSFAPLMTMPFVTFRTSNDDALTAPVVTVETPVDELPEMSFRCAVTFTEYEAFSASRKTPSVLFLTMLPLNVADTFDEPKPNRLVVT